MKFSSRLCLYGTAALCAVGVAYSYLPLSVSGEAPPVVARRPRFVPVAVENEKVVAKSDIEKRAIAFLTAGDFSALDAMAKEFRLSQAAFADGYWKLSLFYQVVADLDAEAPEEVYQTRLTLLRSWFEQDPESITARVAMARVLIDYAWHVRGIEYAHDVKREAWPIVYERITEASRILEAARDLPERCPCWYTTWMIKSMLSHDDPDRYDEILAEGLEKFPTYTPLYFMKVWRLQEKWFGMPGQWEAFAKESADRVGGEQGDILYAQMLWWMHNSRNYGNPIAESTIVWSRARRGFEAIRRQYPDSILALSEYCAISGFAPEGAARLMSELFDEVGNRVDLTVWREMDLFLRDRTWAYSRR